MFHHKMCLILLLFTYSWWSLFITTLYSEDTSSVLFLCECTDLIRPLGFVYWWRCCIEFRINWGHHKWTSSEYFLSLSLYHLVCSPYFLCTLYILCIFLKFPRTTFRMFEQFYDSIHLILSTHFTHYLRATLT